MMYIGFKIPWQIKIVAKVLLNRLPVRYSLWRNLNLFRHGEMEKPEYAYTVFKAHFDRVDFSRKNHGFVCLEIGPGDSLLSALIARAFGACSSYLVDIGSFARNDLKPYRTTIELLLEMGLPLGDLSKVNSLKELLTECGAQYMTQGLMSLRSIPSQSVYFIWSQAVCEHIRRSEFLDTMLELRRIIRPDGICSHRVDLKDHLGGALNNLRFSDRFWEADFIAKSGFYTNRIRHNEMLDLFQKANFDTQVIKVDRWNTLPTPIAKLAHNFKKLSINELCVSGFDVILRPV